MWLEEMGGLGGCQGDVVGVMRDASADSWRGAFWEVSLAMVDGWVGWAEEQQGKWEEGIHTGAREVSKRVTDVTWGWQ